MPQIPIQHSSNQAGLDAVKFCETARKVLKANIYPLLPLEQKIEAQVAINRMDHNELRAALINLGKSEPGHQAREWP
ncbi:MULTISPECIES: hypothetical protein [Cupriavidus]|jgi:hypothetical protein|uniref:hypothetical protein n=1 Tax=Cupriavidus TaxID=106589 RepID=UPI000CE0081C|nr:MULTISPECIES: hypothetical protein [Cupriavidus]AVA38039.1 hypothetical protein C3Z06_30990 [Cupriavidus metallidurans]